MVASVPVSNSPMFASLQTSAIFSSAKAGISYLGNTPFPKKRKDKFNFRKIIQSVFYLININ